MCGRLLPDCLVTNNPGATGFGKSRRGVKSRSSQEDKTHHSIRLDRRTGCSRYLPTQLTFGEKGSGCTSSL